MCNVVPGAFAGVRSGGEGANEKQLACQFFISQMCVCPVVPLHPGSISRPVAGVGSLNKCQCNCPEGSLQDKVVNVTSLGRDRVEFDVLHNIRALAKALTNHDVQVIAEMIQIFGIVKVYMRQRETLLYLYIYFEEGSDSQWSSSSDHNLY